ncbi:MAG: FAD-binding oxidoreductase [Leptolyngbya sp. SIO4C1]|nr:FAD-binding oxidoreductase [Leptolyngbya sp. SIO4C1]
MKRRAAIVGCGIVGAMIAYELSQVSDLEVHVFDRQSPAQGSTGAALGVLMGIISHKVKGRTWRLREASIRRYHSLIPELEAKLGQSIPFNYQGILSLCFAAESLERWQSLQAKRQAQGWPLEIWSPSQLHARCPHIQTSGVQAAIYSPQDGQVSPTELTLALVAAAAQQGAVFHWQTEITGLCADGQACQQLQTSAGTVSVDWVVLSAGLGSAALSQASDRPVAMVPVLGQAMTVRLSRLLGDPAFQPVINGDDIHLVPLGEGRYWIGATVEFPPETGVYSWQELAPKTELLETLRQGAIAYCPALATADVIKTWVGLRPRPQGQAAPVIQPLSGYRNVTVASGHYRNGVLLAPATALQVKAMIAAG